MYFFNPINCKERKPALLFLFGIMIVFSVSVSLMAQTLPAGFSKVLVSNGISRPTVMAFAPDGRIFVGQQDGALKVIKNGAMLPTNFLKLNVATTGERGLIGIALDPNFATNNFLYLYYTLPDASKNRISRFTANGDVVVPGSEVVVLDLDPLNATNHNGGALHFKDGKLFVAVGDNAVGANAQNLDTYHGKLLRINPDGSVPTGNPFTTGSEQRKRVWAYGLRNPYTFDVQPGTGRIFVNDVGQNTWEEINDATTAGRNFGWPTAEGNSSNTAFTNPVYIYGRGTGDGTGCAITGGVFFNPSSTNYPAQYVGRYFFQDLCNRWINTLSLSGTTATRSSFATSLGGDALSLEVGTDGNLYFLERSTSSLFKITYTNNTAPAIASHPANLTVSAGQSASFSVTATGTAPLSHQWQKNNVNISGATAATFTIPNVSSSDAGNYRVVVTNNVGSVTSNVAILTVNVFNAQPVAQILTPATGTMYRGGDTVRFSGNGTDTEDGTLPAAAFSWSVDFHHDTHKHDGPPIAAGVKAGYFVIPGSGEVSANVFYRLYLMVTDSKGLSDTVSRDILPHKSTISLSTQPAGLNVTVDGQPVASPFSNISVEGVQRSIGVVSPQTLGGKTYTFDRWLHGGSATQTIFTPVNDVTYTAVYKETPTTITLEAENATLVGPKVLSNHSGYTGTGFADYQNNSNDYIEWNANAPSAGAYTLRFRYALGASARNLAIRVNGTLVASSLSFARTTSWSTWNTISINANLIAGQNRIRATAIGSSGPNIDHLVVIPGAQLVASSALAENGEALLFPNPAANFLNVNIMASKGDKVGIQLLNTIGQSVNTLQFEAEKDGVNTIVIDVQRFKDGLYFLRIKNGENTTIRKAYIYQ